MNDIPTPDEARDWIRGHPEKMAGLSIAWEVAAEHDSPAYHRLLNLLFAPRPERPAA